MMKGLHFLDKVWENTYDELDLPVYIVQEQEQWDNFTDLFGHKFMPEILETVTMAIKEDLLKVPVFKVLFIASGKSITAVCKRDSFDEALTTCIKFFESTEEFEKCQSALNMIAHEG